VTGLELSPIRQEPSRRLLQGQLVVIQYEVDVGTLSDARVTSGRQRLEAAT